MTVIVVAIALTLLVIAACLAYIKEVKKVKKAGAIIERMLEVYGKWDVEKLRKKADNIINGSFKIDDNEVLGLYLGLKIKQAKEGELYYEKDIGRIEQLWQLYLKRTKPTVNETKEE